MLASEFEKLTPQNLKWFSKYTDVVLLNWEFSVNQIGTIHLFINRTEIIEARPQIFLSSNEYINSELHFEDADLRVLNDVLNPILFNELYTYHPPIQPPIEPISQSIANEVTYTLEIIIESAHDLQVKYLNTYGLKDSIPIYITSIESHSCQSTHKIYYYIINPDLSMASKISYNIGEFNMTLPKIGMINTDKVVVLLERKHKRESPARYRKALVPESLNIINISESSIKELGIPNLYDPYGYGNKNVIQKLLYDIYNPKKFTYKEALNLVNSGIKISCAFSQSLAISACFITNKIYLYKNQWILGIYIPKKNLFSLTNDYFSSELDRYGVIYEYK